MIKTGQVVYDQTTRHLCAFAGMVSDETAVVVYNDGSYGKVVFTNLIRLEDNHNHEYEGMAVKQAVHPYGAQTAFELAVMVTAVKRAIALFRSELVTVVHCVPNQPV